MMNSARITLVVFSLVLVQIVSIKATELFEIKIESVEICQDVPAADKSRMHVYVSHDKNPKGLISGNVTILEDDDPIGQKFEVYKWKDGIYDDIYTFNSANICGSNFMNENVHNFFLKMIHNNKECYVKKGVNVLDDVDVQKIAKIFLKNDILFGKYKCLLEYYGPKGKILCFNTILNLNRV